MIPQLLIPMIGKSMDEMAKQWVVSPESGEVEVEVSEYFQKLTGEVVSRAVLGCGYKHGEAVLGLQAQHEGLAADSLRNFFPGYWYDFELQMEKGDRFLRTNVVEELIHEAFFPRRGTPPSGN